MPLTPAPDGYPIKLVRDRTAEVINSSKVPGDLFYARLDEDADLGEWLRKKLGEEVLEYVVAPGVDELADVLAVVEALAATHGHSLDALVQIERGDPRGGFLNGVMMYGHHPEFDDYEPS